MQLKDLYKNFGTSTPGEQAEFIAQYRLRRSQDLEKVVSSSTRKSSSVTSLPKIELSSEEKLLMKKLGLKMRDITALRSSVVTENDDEKDEATLLVDNTFDDEEDS